MNILSMTTSEERIDERNKIEELRAELRAAIMQVLFCKSDSGALGVTTQSDYWVTKVR